NRVAQLDSTGLERPGPDLCAGDIAHHARRLPEQNLERHVHRLAAEERVGDDQLTRVVDIANDRVRTALPRGNRGKGLEGLRGDHDDVALLRFVAPELER